MAEAKGRVKFDIVKNPKWNRNVQGWEIICKFCHVQVWFMAGNHPQAPAPTNRGLRPVILPIQVVPHVCSSFSP